MFRKILCKNLYKEKKNRFFIIVLQQLFNHSYYFIFVLVYPGYIESRQFNYTLLNSRNFNSEYYLIILFIKFMYYFSI